MRFDPKLYGDEVAAILALDGSGERVMPLARGICSCEEARQRLRRASPAALFAGSRAPDAAMSGLYLYFSCLDDAHEIAQSVETPEGSFWHAILHRQEPDAGNSSYWFRRVGRHPIFPTLRNEAAALGVDFGPQWDPYAFIRMCESDDPRALAVQRTEWQLLFDYCASKKAAAGPSSK